MKLRIKGNSIRLRLTQSEVEDIIKGKAVKETVSFGDVSPSFHYVLESDSASKAVSAHYTEHTICIQLPEAEANSWATTEQVGIEREIPLQKDESLYVLIEKDFQCLHQRPREDEQDNFPNPAAESKA
ncbi:hypothetical protein OKW21_004301 [Catalinimonas alkaloidigena]|uniref:DUF7009 family protein n=1 Tax=Catalinimonas alkaloidigena TaxID=1075417 RepID=UPI0024056F7A|nr:hypothetical protein [Catalinimonas alkaloidigena]MDF9799038.1 hypothetical protein [Catalinimonas alkaloidigena]